MDKKDLFSIGQVSKLFHVSISILRYYDKIGLVQPEYTDPETGYRYYSTRQFECLNTIRYLRVLDMPLDQIALFLKNRNVDCMQELLKQQKEEVIRRQQELKVIQKKIENRLHQIKDALSSKLGVITVVKTPPRRLASLRTCLAPKNYLDLEVFIRELEQQEENSVTFLGKVGVGISAASLMKGKFWPYEMVFILLDEEDSFRGETVLLPEENSVMIRFQGGHGESPEYYGKLMEYIRENGYKIRSFSQEITMIDDGLTSDVSQFVTEIQIPVDLGKGSEAEMVKV